MENTLAQRKGPMEKVGAWLKTEAKAAQFYRGAARLDFFPDIDPAAVPLPLGSG